MPRTPLIHHPDLVMGFPHHTLKYLSRCPIWPLRFQHQILRRLHILIRPIPTTSLSHRPHQGAQTSVVVSAPHLLRILEPSASVASWIMANLFAPMKSARMEQPLAVWPTWDATMNIFIPASAKSTSVHIILANVRIKTLVVQDEALEVEETRETSTSELSMRNLARRGAHLARMMTNESSATAFRPWIYSLGNNPGTLDISFPVLLPPLALPFLHPTPLALSVNLRAIRSALRLALNGVGLDHYWSFSLALHGLVPLPSPSGLYSFGYKDSSHRRISGRYIWLQRFGVHGLQVSLFHDTGACSTGGSALKTKISTTVLFIFWSPLFFLCSLWNHFGVLLFLLRFSSPGSFRR